MAHRNDEPSTAERAAAATTPRPRSLLLTLVGAVAAVVIGVSGAGVTHAFLTATVTQPGATITAGTAGIQINGATAAALGSVALSPAAPAVWSFTVANTGNVALDLSARISAPAGPAFAPVARAVLAPVAGAAACSAALAGTPAALDGFTAPALGTVAAGASQTYCLVVSLPNPTPAAGSGSPLGFTVTVDAAQNAS